MDHLGTPRIKTDIGGDIEAEARNNAFLERMGIEPDGVKLGMMPIGPGAFNLGSAARAGRVALDTNAIIARLEGGAAGAAAVARAIGQRSPIVSITAVKEFLVKGNVSSLRAFLKETGGGLAKAGSKDLVKRLESLGLKRADAEVVASAIVEKVKLITTDKKVAKVVAEIVESF